MIFNNRVDIFEENKRLREELEQERRLRKEWQERCLELEKKVNELEAKLNRILNPNTPSSQIPDTEKESRSSARANKGKKPRGKPRGGNGGVREPPKEIDREINATADKCPHCDSDNIEHLYTDDKYIYDLPLMKIIITLFHIFYYRCNKCQSLFQGTHPELPKEGIIGPNLTAFIIELKHGFAASYEKLSSFLEDLYEESFSAQAINDCVSRTAKTLKPEYARIRKNIVLELFSHIDETKWPINGERFYLWLFHTLNYVFIEINKSRGRKVVINVLGYFYEGIVISDCLKVYRSFAAAFQKCWAHLLRKTYALKEKNPKSDIVQLHEQLTKLYEEAEKARTEKMNESERIWAGIRLTQKMQRITNHPWKSKEAKGIIDNWLKEYKGQWLVGVFIPEVELTNNKDERGIRKVIPTRKMLGGHRTEQGAQDFAIIETNRQTWKLNKKTPYKELQEYLKTNNIKVAT